MSHDWLDTTMTCVRVTKADLQKEIATIPWT